MSENTKETPSVGTVGATAVPNETWPQHRARNIKAGIAPNDASISSVWAQKRAVTSSVADPHDKKFDYFEYDETATQYEFEQANPLNVPMDIAKKYPGMRFRWRKKDEKAGTLVKGNDHLGWKIFTDEDHKSGVRAGGDLVLTAMPEARAAAYNEYTRNQSTDKIRDEQLKNIEAGYGVTGGVVKVTNKATGEVSEQHRGMHPEELEELAAKNQEQKDRNIVYSR